MKLLKAFQFLLIVALMILLAETSLEACPTCRETLSENDSHLVSGYFWSIVFMMAMPFILLGSLSAYFYFQVLRARATMEENAVHST